MTTISMKFRHQSGKETEFSTEIRGEDMMIREFVEFVAAWAKAMAYQSCMPKIE